MRGGGGRRVPLFTQQAVPPHGNFVALGRFRLPAKRRSGALVAAETLSIGVLHVMPSVNAGRCGEQRALVPNKDIAVSQALLARLGFQTTETCSTALIGGVVEVETVASIAF